MTRHRPGSEPLPPCYALTLPGLEEIAAEEITDDLGGEVKRTARGLVVFRVPAIDRTLLELRTVEDVFVLAWGTDKLSYRADALDSIRRWTAREADWDRLLRLHHAVRPKPKGRPTYRLVTQMTGEHGFRRIDAREALAAGLAGKLPASWRHVEEGAAVEIWLTIHGATAVCGVRLSDRTMRHRTYKREHLPASLRPTLAAAMVRLGSIRPGQVVLDPMCGAGTILAEQLQRWGRPLTPHPSPPEGERGGFSFPLSPASGERGGFSFPLSPASGERGRGEGGARAWGGDLDPAAVRAASINLRRLGPVLLARWDAARLPLPDQSVDCILSNPPFGKQLGRPEEIGFLYRRVLPQYDRVLRPGGRAVLLVSDPAALKEAAAAVGWKRERQFRVEVLGQPAFLSAWRKPG
ncbi:MAG TPA: methyltransferase domain-containing protein [Gemmataceae bacterium]|nr:methyltransferase domain-containing protein [Gemmataceae bacterium]